MIFGNTRMWCRVETLTGLFWTKIYHCI